MTTTLSVAELEQLVGGPQVQNITAKLQNDSVTLASEAGPLALADSMPIAALGVAPMLSYADLLSIEAVFQHVVRNTVTYSKAVWLSLTPEERGYPRSNASPSACLQVVSWMKARRCRCSTVWPTRCWATLATP